MASFNKITLIGNLGRDPELRNVNAEMRVAEFSIAVTERSRVNGQMQEKTEWFRVSFWNQKADVVMNYLRKGSPVYVEGRLSVRSYVDKDGKDRYSLEVQGSELTLIGGRENSEGGSAAAPSSYGASSAAAAPMAAAPVAPPPAPMASSAADDDLPF
ncbi:single-strand DNA-binding protein [Flexibacter flexilis DSM 6793]|uniref:Single-stranded DNA-binding protein n=1 Tax=Flexibacter flexilis DSM 6793 TaxID=927664 RepID=A0A1I1KX40_9BACT|nr:single-stranded DNA-binding protein [Flexibacter flexilis]SFC62703.1 single-strand DNA-binding protein [Flexibacter flexilis DSM 6793]